MQWQLEYEAPPLEDVSGRSAPSGSVSRQRVPGRISQWLLQYAPTMLLILAGLVIWQLFLTEGEFLGVPAQYLGSPFGAFETFLTLLRDGYTGTPLWAHFVASILRTLAGVTAAVVIGVPLGLAIGLNRFLDRLLGPVIGFLRPIPALAWIPIVVIWMGIGEESKVFVIFMTALLFVTTGATLGVRAVPRDFYLVAQNYRLSRLQFLRRVVLPPALPQILAGMRTALTVGWAVVVAAELIGASQGLGYMIRNSSQVFDVNTGYVGILLIGLVGVVFEYGFRFFERRLLHWQVSR
jgi:taurine transport system permease protein